MIQPVRYALITLTAIVLGVGTPLISPPLSAEVSAPLPQEAPSRKLENLTNLIATIAQVKNELADDQRALASPASLGKEAWYRNRIDRLTIRLTALEEGFEQLATGVDKPAIQSGKKKESFQWSNELTELLAPLIREMKHITARPREIQGLRNTLEVYNGELHQAQRALTNIANLQMHSGLTDSLSEHLEALTSKWRYRHQELTSLKGLVELKLDEKKKGKRSLSESIQDFTRLFFKSRGRNLLTVLGVIFGILFGMSKLRGVIQRHSHTHKHAQTIYTRVFDLSYLIVTLILALLATVATLYLVSDWVLLSIVLIFILGLLWASKEAIPRVWGQGRMLLNLGTVREGERIIYQGVPYRVTHINLHSELNNEALQGGLLRLPLNDLFTLRSRPCHPDEPWFPSRCGDWVLLSDATHAEVTVQSPEFIGLRLLGGAVKHLPPSAFLAMAPTNLSGGFRLESHFRLALTHRNGATTALPDQLATGLRTRLAATSWGLKALQVCYRRTLPSFLELTILADFPGGCAKDHPLIRMALEQFCLETAQEWGWELPTHRMAVQVQGQEKGGLRR